MTVLSQDYDYEDENEAGGVVCGGGTCGKPREMKRRSNQIQILEFNLVSELDLLE